MSDDRETLGAGCCFVALLLLFLGIGWVLFTNRLDVVAEMGTTIRDYISGHHDAPPSGYYPPPVAASYRSHQAAHREHHHPQAHH